MSVHDELLRATRCWPRPPRSHADLLPPPLVQSRAAASSPTACQTDPVRLSEKTVELNFCAELSILFAPIPVTWVGLTQRQEAAHGFDAMTHPPGARALFLQFKASNRDVRHRRRFVAAHQQLVRLAALARDYPRSVFYVFPLVGTTQELAAVGNHFLPSTYLLDAADLAALKEPRTPTGSLRRSGLHYVDISPPDAYVRSDPQRFNLLAAPELVAPPRTDPRFGLPLTPETATVFRDLTTAFSRHAVALLLP